MSNRENIIGNASAIKTLLEQYGVVNESLDSFLKEANDLPSSDILDEYNSLVDNFNESRGQAKSEAAQSLISFYDKNRDVLSHKNKTIETLRKFEIDNERLMNLYEKLESELLVENYNTDNIYSYAKEIQTLLNEYNVSNDSLNVLVKEIQEMPSADVLDQYEKLVDKYNDARGSNEKLKYAEQILKFYDSNSEDLVANSDSIEELRRYYNDFNELISLYDKLAESLEAGDY